MSLQGLTTVLPPPRRGEAPGFIGSAQETYDRRTAFRRAGDAFEQQRLRHTDDRGRMPQADDRRRPVSDEPQTGLRAGRRATDRNVPGGLHLKLAGHPEFVRHSTPFVAQAIGQERGVIEQVRQRGLGGGTAAYDAGIARVDSFFNAIEPIEVYA